MKRPSHTQFRQKYCKESGEDTEKENWKETEDKRVEDQFRFRRAKETESDITGILDIDEEFCVCFINWQKALTV